MTPARWLGKASFFVLVFALVSCNFPGQSRPTPTHTPNNMTAAAQTVVARLTLLPGETGGPPPPVVTTPPPQPPTEPPPTLTSTNTPLATATTIPCNRAAFISDVTVPDGTKFAPDTDFTKTWRLRNTGSCTWDSDYSLVFDTGDSMGGDPATELTAGTVVPGQTIDVSIDLTAPNSTGDYKGFYKIRQDTTGVVFGIGDSAEGAFYVDIEVANPTATPIPVLSSGELDISQTGTADLDAGVVAPPGSDRDLWFQAAVLKYIVPENGAKFKLMGGTVPSLSTCMSTTLSTNKILLTDISVGDWLCYETNEGNFGRFEVEGLTIPVPQVLTIDYKTWDT